MVVPQGPAAELRRLTQARERSMKTGRLQKSTSRSCVYNISRTFECYETIDKNRCIYSQKLSLSRGYYFLGQKSLAEIVRRISRGKFTAQKALTLFEAAQTSVGVKEGRTSIILEIKYLIDMIEHHNQFIDSLEKQMCTYLEQIPYSQNILSIKGIGDVTTAGLIGEVGDFKAFSTIPEIMKLAGLDLYEVSSGGHKGQRRISKRGRPLIRKLLFFVSH